ARCPPHESWPAPVRRGRLEVQPGLLALLPRMCPAPDAGRDPAASASLSRLLETPREIGPFKILRMLGAGGMGIVFLAQQEKPTGTVALKVIHGRVLSPRTLRRFEQEAEVLARLQHPGIAQVYQVGTYTPQGATPQGELPYIAMEYVEG